MKIIIIALSLCVNIAIVSAQEYLNPLDSAKADEQFYERAKELDKNTPVNAATVVPYLESTGDLNKTLALIMHIAMNGPITGEKTEWTQTRLMLMQTFQNALLIEQNKRIIALLEAQAQNKSQKD